MFTAKFDLLNVRVHADRAAMGAAAAVEAGEIITRTIAEKGSARVVFACAPSQSEMLAVLRGRAIEWPRVTAFHMDEYVGVAAEHPASFRRYLREHLLRHVHVREFHGIRGEAPDARAECARYAGLLQAAPIDLVCLGIGENGHLAFNDPPVADFSDPAAVKLVELDEPCRRQQVNDGCFSGLDAVPRHALTLTIPMLLAARALVVTVPGPRKAAAVRAALLAPVATSCPASILRTHRSAWLHLDREAAAGLAEAAPSVQG